MVTLPDVWCYRISAETGWPGDSIPWLDEKAKFDAQLLSQCGSTYTCGSRFIPETHRVAGGLEQPTNMFSVSHVAEVSYWYLTPNAQPTSAVF